MDKKGFFGWFKKKESDKTYTLVEVEDLLRRVKLFKAGAINKHLEKHINNVFSTWKNELGGK